MNFLVVGPGAMGCLFATRLKKVGHQVTIADYKPQRADFINRHGICIEESTGEERVHVPAVTVKTGEEPDVALICVKANQTREAAEEIVSWIDLQTSVLSLQNGLGNLELLEEVFGKGRVLGGVTAEGATLLGPGHARHAGRGQTIIGPTGKADGPVTKIVHAFEDAGFDTRSADEVESLIWGKLIVNVGINALTAITRVKNGLLPAIQGARTVMKMAVGEAERVAHAKGIDLPYPDPFERVLEVCRGTAENKASMLQDVLGQRITEIQFINGAIVREGERLGIPTPVNLTLTSLVEAIQETYDQRVVA
ncbi:MAG: 2-dehydropantoate 2-reductase [Deltaproteobacteria bacterium]|nr:2-dehydropantoate 2-reductase [Deltaproteobacteria bacterium]